MTAWSIFKVWINGVHIGLQAAQSVVQCTSELIEDPSGSAYNFGRFNVEIINRGLPMSVGYVYVLSNRLMPGLVKIGFTTNDVKRRVAELSSATGVPAPFEIEYYCLTKHPGRVEREVHRDLAAHRLQNREFFSVDVARAISAVEPHITPVEQERYSRSDRMPSASLVRSKPLYQCAGCGALNEVKVCARCGLNWDD